MSDDESNHSRRRWRGSDEESSNEELEDEDDYDSEEEEERRPSKKKKTNKGHHGFVIEEAEVDDDMDEEEEWDGSTQEIGIDINEADEVGPTAREIEGRQRGRNLFENRREDEIEDYFRRKYASTSDTGLNEQFGEGEEMSDEIFQQTLLPSVKDPNLWLVKCRIGDEKATALLLMRKFLTYERTDRVLQIKSVVAPEGAKGFIYVEAYKQVNVKEAIENVGSLKAGFWNQQMVPIKEMTDVLDVHKEQINLVHKQWVRPKRGTYKDDIAQVDFVEVAQNKVILKLVPRIDYTKKRGALRALDDDDDFENEDDEPSRTKRKRRMTSKNRPPQKLFDAEAIKELGGEISPDGDFMMFENNRYSTKGFLYKSFNIKSIISGGVKPTLSELEMFEDNPEESHFEMPATENVVEHNFSPGDHVEVCQGELTGLTGKILSVDGKKIVVMPFHESLTEPLEFPATELQKSFEVGNHVKIIDGKHEGDTGFVIRAEQNRLIIFSDLSMHEIDIFSRYVQLCPDVATGVDSVGQFQFGDLVNVDSQTVGVIVRLERDLFHVLTMHGKLQEMKPQGLSRVPNFAKASALDAQQNIINRNDAVQVIDGPHSGRNGKIKYLYRYFAFIQAQNHVDNGGIIVCKTRHIQLQGSSRVSISYPAVITFKPPKPTASPMITASPIHITETSGNSTPVVDFGRGNVGGGRATRRHRDIIGSTVKIIRGPYKGSVGYCKDATESTVRVELTSSYQTVTFSRANVQNMEPKVDGYQSNQRNANPISGSQTPMYRPTGSKTPMYEVGSRTPHYGYTTPSSLDGSRTPQSSAWDPSVTNTPARPNDFDDFGGEDGASPASFTRGYDPTLAPYTPQITDSEDWDADSNTASPTAHRAKVATPPTRRGPLVREGRPKTFNRPARETAPVANRKLGDENWDDEDDEQPKRFDPRANEKPAVEDFGRFQGRPTKKWGNNGGNANPPRRPGNPQFGNRRNDVPRAGGGLGSTENWDEEDGGFNNTPQIPSKSQFENKSTENWGDGDNFAAPIPPRGPTNPRFENKRTDLSQPVGGLGSTENWDEEDDGFNNTPQIPTKSQFENKRTENWDEGDNFATPIPPRVSPNPRFENKRNDIPPAVGGLGSTENWDEEDNFNAPEVPSTPHVPPNPRFDNKRTDALANPRPPHVSAKFGRQNFENKRKSFPPAATGLGSTENWDEEDDCTPPVASTIPRGPVNPRFENKQNDVPRAVGGFGQIESWDKEDNYTASTTPHEPANPRFGSTRNESPRALGGLGSTESWDNEDNFAAPIAPSAPRVPAKPRFENKRDNFPRPVGGLGSTENWDEEDNCAPPATPNTPYVPANPRFENKRNDVPRPAVGLNSTENWDEEQEFVAPIASSTPRLPVAPRFENQRNNFSRPARGRGNKRIWNNNNNNNFKSPDANSFSRLPKIPKFANKRNDAPNIIGGLDNSEKWDDDEDAPVNCPSLPSSTNSFSYQKSPAHKVEYSEPAKSFTSTTRTTDEYAWITPDLEVIINDSYEDWDFAGQDAVVNSVSGDKCNVTVKTTNQSTSVPCSVLTPLIPEVNERVKIIKGDFRNKVGTFESLVDNNGVVRTDSGESQVVSLDYLCKTRQ